MHSVMIAEDQLIERRIVSAAQLGARLNLVARLVGVPVRAFFIFPKQGRLATRLLFA
jgi:hypothetical protein